jgi:hypothetical protein
MRQWQEVGQRLRGQLEELEAKHDLLREGLVVEEATVLMFAQDLIRRIDLIDALTKRFAGAPGGVEEQLLLLRGSLEDILLQHGIVEFDIEAGTEVDVEMRRRITVVESAGGGGRVQVADCVRTGFLRVMEDGSERILRKVEVRLKGG